MKDLKHHVFFFLAAIGLLNPLTASARMAPAINVVQFQQQLGVSDQPVDFKTDKGEGKARLLGLGTMTGSWFVLYIQRAGENNWNAYHLENVNGAAVHLSLNDKGLTLQTPAGPKNCEIFDQIDEADKIAAPYVPLCDGKLTLRHHAKGDAGEWKELGANTLRDNFGSFGESIVDKYKATRDVRGDQSEVGSGTNATATVNDASAPEKALIDPKIEAQPMTLPNLNIALKNDVHSVIPGSWYALKNQAGMFFSAMKGELVHPLILEGNRERVKPFDGVEEKAVDYLVAFDLSQFNIGWSHGSRLPGVAWSDRNDADRAQVPNGPDGFAGLSPLQMNGLLNPNYFSNLTATMCGGFQRKQAVFKYGDLAKKNHGSYYGFLQEGVVLSTLNPGLATFIIYNDGRIDIKTWTEDDDKHIPEIRFARQNGVPLVERDSAGKIVPGGFVGSWALGNWSGSTNDLPEDDPSVKGLLRSQRAAACITHHDGRDFLIYGYFSAATPNAMARVLESYRCDYAIHLDMNSAGQGYLGILSHSGDRFFVEHPVKEMAGRDGKLRVSGGTEIPAPRFAAVPDEADFFYFLRRK